MEQHGKGCMHALGTASNWQPAYGDMFAIPYVLKIILRIGTYSDMFAIASVLKTIKLMRAYGNMFAITTVLKTILLMQLSKN